MNVEISKSNKSGKKFKAVIDNKKTIHFGDSAYSDYTKHKDPERKNILVDIQMKTIAKII